MDIEIKLNVNKDLYDIFQIVLKRSNHNEKEVVENFLLSYATKQMEQDIRKDITLSRTVTSDDYRGKANHKIPKWAHSPNQYNHKIIKSYFKLLETSGQVTLYNMELLCSDSTKPDLYVPTFKANYASMKLDGQKSHGRVFEDDGKYVTIWSEVEQTLMKFKRFFE
ncbi:MAG: hypothetical protein RBQ97_09285 [Acholeplasma sp.]|nr:hypothetical protein [Acholeplasma sp.]